MKYIESSMDVKSTLETSIFSIELAICQRYFLISIVVENLKPFVRVVFFFFIHKKKNPI